MGKGSRLLFIGLLALGTALGAYGEGLAQCSLEGNITADPNLDQPELGAWKYTLTVTWDTDSPFALSHFNLLLDEENANCSCEELAAALTWVDPAGHSDGEPAACQVPYLAMIECSGDPSIDTDGIMIKFEPLEEGCEPGPTGSGTFCFYSDYPPSQVGLPNLFMQDKFALNACFGPLTGVFPGLPCNPLPATQRTWGAVKEAYDAD